MIKDKYGNTQCPLRFSMDVLSKHKRCLRDKCAWWNSSYRTVEDTEKTKGICMIEAIFIEIWNK